MSIAKVAYMGLFGREPEREMKLRYSRRFRGYNANVRYNERMMEFGLSRHWKGISQDIQIGLLQTLILKATGRRAKTVNTELYNIFLKKVHQASPKERIDGALFELFCELNREYFGSLLETPNLVWGRNSLRKLGSYDYGTDTVTLSSVLKPRPDLTKYVLYHELLHKKHKYSADGRGSLHHSPGFRHDERQYRGHDRLEKELAAYLRKKKGPGWLGF